MPTSKQNFRVAAGFTLIELMLAMAFLASILLFSSLVFVQALNTYNKGLTIKQINETGRALTTDLNRSSSGAHSFAVSNPGSGLPTQFLCIGKTAYIWNIKDNPSARTYVFNDGSELTMVRTKEGIDARNLYCRDGGSTVVDKSHVNNLIGDQARVLEVSVLQPQAGGVDVNPLEVPLVRLSLTIGTSSADGAVDPVKVTPPGGGASYWQCAEGNTGNFCAVGTYSTTIYIAGGA